MYTDRRDPVSLLPAAVGAVVPAAGRGERFRGAVPKSLVPLHGRPLVQYALETLHRVEEVVAIVVVGPAYALGAMRELVASAGLDKVTAVVPGGADRQASVARGLEALPVAADLVLVHDGARPCASPSLARAVAAAAATAGAATAAVAVEETIKRGQEGWVASTLDRSQLYRIQTPQAFHRALLERAHREAARAGFHGTDDASLVERLGHPVRLVAGEPANLKVTVPEDLAVAEALLRRAGAPAQTARVGLGFDAHRFVEGRPLMLGGVEIPWPRGLAGWSDADAVVHAIMDALLGAAGCGDIGQHFPPGDPAYAGADSLALLGHVRDLLAARGWRAAHVDVVVMAEAPRLAPHIPAMRAAIGGVLGLGADAVNLKATTLEGMGALGREEGIAAQAVATLAPTAIGGRAG
ncbi:MAG TPA: 2-C-methyl-D-erythritol 4-phosphate cytidylyltransferase [bacterium]|nr:2-C-methyl-D-erythritol 4-phosphate cytidylyltransferase [bacterium]